MKTTSTYTQGKLTIAIAGHIDSSEAKALQEELRQVIEEYEDDDIDELILDMSTLDFISSMGLRCVLQLKQQHPSLRVINCAPQVYEVFKMAGFTKIITIEKALAEISLEGLQCVEGLTDTYQLNDETMLRVLPSGATLADVEHELQLSRELFVMGIPTVMTFDKVRVGDRYGLVYESLTLRDISAIELGAMMRQLHSHTVDPGGLIPAAIDKERAELERRSEDLGDDVVDKLRQVLAAIPAGSSLLQHSFDSQRVGYNGDEPIMVEVSDICYGNPFIDLARMYAAMPDEKRGTYFDEFLHSYFETASDEAIASHRQMVTALATALQYDGDVELDEVLSKLHFKMDFAEEIRRLERERFYLDCEVNVGWVANKLGTNRHYVSDYFNNVLHTSFNDYINNLRLEYAVELLRTGRATASQIAYTAGFNSDHTFRRLFKQKYGCSPSQFEKE